MPKKKLSIAIVIPVLAPLILHFNEKTSKVRKSGNKINSIPNTNEDDKKLTLKMEDLDEPSEYDEYDILDEKENEDKKEKENEHYFELIEPIRNFLTFVNAPIVKFFYFQVN